MKMGYLNHEKLWRKNRFLFHFISLLVKVYVENLTFSLNKSCMLIVNCLVYRNLFLITLIITIYACRVIFVQVMLVTLVEIHIIAQ